MYESKPSRSSWNDERIERIMGTLLQSGRGVIFGDVDIQWWATQIQTLNASLGYNDPTHLPIYLTDSVLLHIGPNPFNCCVIGFHGAGPVPSHTSNGPQNGNGNQLVQTWAWASWVRPGIYARPNGGLDWALQDIHALSHEVAEWADDPFINNTVEPWLTPTAPQYGCTNLLETGDVLAIDLHLRLEEDPELVALDPRVGTLVPWPRLRRARRRFVGVAWTGRAVHTGRRSAQHGV